MQIQQMLFLLLTEDSAGLSGKSQMFTYCNVIRKNRLNRIDKKKSRSQLYAGFFNSIILQKYLVLTFLPEHLQ